MALLTKLPNPSGWNQGTNTTIL